MWLPDDPEITWRVMPNASGIDWAGNPTAAKCSLQSDAEGKYLSWNVESGISGKARVGAHDDFAPRGRGDELRLSRLSVTALAANNGFESGSDETTITTGNSGPDAFDAVLLGAGNALVYDSARAAHGVLSARIDLGAASGSTASMQWTFTEATEVWGWFYVFITGNPGAGLRICGGEQAGLGNWRMNLAVTGQIQVLDQNFAGAVNTTAAVPQNVWHRVGWRVLCSETVGQIEARIYEGDSTTPITDGTCSDGRCQGHRDRDGPLRIRV